VVEGEVRFVQCLAAEHGGLVVYEVTQVSHATITLPWETFHYHILLVDRQAIPFAVTTDTPVTRRSSVMDVGDGSSSKWLASWHSDELCRASESAWWARVFGGGE
jgi:hypothetical protein